MLTDAEVVAAFLARVKERGLTLPGASRESGLPVNTLIDWRSKRRTVVKRIAYLNRKAAEEWLARPI